MCIKFNICSLKASFGKNSFKLKQRYILRNLKHNVKMTQVNEPDKFISSKPKTMKLNLPCGLLETAAVQAAY